MTLWDVPKELEIGVIPKRLYCNKDLIAPLTKAFQNLIKTGFVNELKTWDGCFNIRGKRSNPQSMSLHSWGVAIDLVGKAYTVVEKSSNVNILSGSNLTNSLVVQVTASASYGYLIIKVS